jgi:hypothetical protein
VFLSTDQFQSAGAPAAVAVCRADSGIPSSRAGSTAAGALQDLSDDAYFCALQKAVASGPPTREAALALIHRPVPCG